jgi:prepilin peptidase CpaA
MIEEICGVSTAFVVITAIVTDLRSRRIPNTLTFTAFGLAVAVRFAFQGWLGLGLALSGAVVAPAILLLAHLGRGLGMGDLKLAAAVGAFLGPVGAIAAMLCSAVLGGVLALALLMRRGQLMWEFFDLLLLGLPFMKRRKSVDPPAESSTVVTMPYGVAIGMGSLVTMAVYAWLVISIQ